MPTTPLPIYILYALLFSLLLYLSLHAALRGARVRAGGFGVVLLLLLAAGFTLDKPLRAWLLEHYVNDVFENNRELRALKEFDEAAWRQAYAQFKQLPHNASETQKEAVLAAPMQQALVRALHVTSDKAILAYIELLQDELRVLLQRNDDSCHRYLFPLPAQAPLPPLPSAMAERNSVIVAQILRDAAKQAQAALSNQRMQALRFAVIGPWANAHPQQFQMLSNPHLPADKQAVCRAAQSLYAHIQNQSLEAAPVLRMMLGRSTR